MWLVLFPCSVQWVWCARQYDKQTEIIQWYQMIICIRIWLMLAEARGKSQQNKCITFFCSENPQQRTEQLAVIKRLAAGHWTTVAFFGGSKWLTDARKFEETFPHETIIERPFNLLCRCVSMPAERIQFSIHTNEMRGKARRPNWDRNYRWLHSSNREIIRTNRRK